jgi:hypothetical protein
MKIYPITVPGGSDSYVQYNNGGIFGGIAGCTLNDATGVLTATGLTATNCAVLGSDSAVFQPNADSTTFFQVLDADGGTPVLNIDSTNERIGIGLNNPAYNLEITTPTADSFALAHIKGNNQGGAWTFEDTRTGGEGGALMAGTSGCIFEFSDTGFFMIQTDAKADIFSAPGTGTNLMRVNSSGGLFLYNSAGDREIKIVPNQVATGDLANGTIIYPADTYDNINITTATTAASQIIGAAYNGSIWRSMYEYESVAAGEPRLMLVKTAGSVGIRETAPETILEITDTAPYITLHNSTHEDSDGGRESRLNFKGEQGVDPYEETTLARIEVSHDGAGADDKGKMVIYTNDGADGDTPTAHIKIDAAGITYIGDGGTTNYCEIESDGTIEFHGASTVWNDANVGAMTLTVPVASQPDEANFLDEGGGDTGITTWAYAIGEKSSGAIEIPHDYKEGSDIYFHIHWQGIAAPSGTDYVKWQLTYTVAAVSGEETLDAATTITIETAFDTQYEFKLSSFAAITGTNFQMGDQFLFSLERVAAAGDVYLGDALIATVGLHYECDTCGSRQMLTKA